MLEVVMFQAQGNQTRAAELLGLNRNPAKSCSNTARLGQMDQIRSPSPHQRLGQVRRGRLGQVAASHGVEVLSTGGTANLLS